MRSPFALLVLVLYVTCGASHKELAVDYPYRPVPFTAVKVTDQFWAPKMETNRTVTIPTCLRKCEETGRIDNFVKAAGQMDGEFVGLRYNDSDVFKVMEAAAYSLSVHPDPELEAYLDRLIATIAEAQEDDGYLYTGRSIGSGDDIERMGAERWSSLIGSHELYNVGHMYEAAVAHYQATGKRSFLDIATDNADLIAATFGPAGIRDVPGHEEIEVGLVKLYRATGNQRYLDLAKFFVDERGNPDRHTMETDRRDRWYSQDHEPIQQQSKAMGHAVRAGYFYAGVSDLAALTRDAAYPPALDRIWHSIVDRRMYVTGGVGAHRRHEGFGEDYELPNAEAYAETCAAIANMLWQHRLFLFHGDAAYIDVLERTLYNGFLSGVSLKGDTFFYPNPLAADGKRTFNQGQATRAPWFRTSCCPVNVARVVPSAPGYVYATRGDEIFVNLYMASEASVELGDGVVGIRQVTEYPWDGKVELTVEPARAEPFAVNLRIPGWARNQPVPSDLYRYVDGLTPPVSIEVNSEPVPVAPERGFVKIERAWKAGDRIRLDLPMPVRLVAAHDEVEADRGRLALERGPVVYCVEGVDNGGAVDSIRIDPAGSFTTEHRADLLGGITVIQAGEVTAVPYYAWSNRGAGPMAVWLPAK